MSVIRGVFVWVRRACPLSVIWRCQLFGSKKCTASMGITVGTYINGYRGGLLLGGSVIGGSTVYECVFQQRYIQRYAEKIAYRQ